MVFTAAPEHIDELGHVNNAVWVQWMEQVAVTHWRNVAEPGHQDDYFWVVVRHEIDYLSSGYQDDELVLGTWLVDWDRRLRMTRQFQLQRPADGVTLLRARTTFVCIELSSGKPRRMPPEFLAGYGQALPGEDV